ncbi:MAG: hypothetical protein Sapg2KO_32330 [Saprospiraceae bacterium]
MQKKQLLQLSLGLLFIALIVGIAATASNKPTISGSTDFPSELLEEHTEWTATKQAYPSVLIFYNPNCEHCQYEAQSLSTHSAFQKTPVYWLSAAEPEALSDFQMQYATDAPASFQFLHDPQHQIGNAMGVRTYPSLFIYDADGHLAHQYEGETKPEAILKYLFNHQ